MRLTLRALLLASLVAGLAVPVEADIPFLSALIAGDSTHLMEGFDLSDEDRTLAKDSQSALLADTAAAPGAHVDWSNPVSGTSGSVILVKAFDYDGLPCRRLAHRFEHRGRADAVYLQTIRCQTAEGTWKSL
jgi:surface antigen